jgi:transaldolase
MTKAHDLYQLGQSIWYDNIRRSFVESGELASMIEQGVRGVTSNPSIFEKAIGQSDDYDEQLKELIAQGKSIEEMYDALVIKDIQMAADVLRPLYDESNGGDGYISLEVSPTLARDTDGTIADARRYVAAVDRPNLMIKIPATPEGIPAIKQAISEGINVNVTLMFSMADYDAVAGAYIEGLQDLVANGGDPSTVASVASFFISRVDGVVDGKLEAIGNTDLQGKIAVANAKLAYERFTETFSGDTWEALAAKGATVQRPLWASTSVKNPAYPDTLYVDTLIGAHTVNTVPPNTLDALLDHGTATDTVGTNMAEAHAQVAQLKDLGIDLDQITADLQDAGVDAFAKAFESLMNSIQEKRDRLG